jgi:hypothetical protein
MSEEDKKNERMKIIYKALEEGWTVKKSDNDKKTFEFSKNISNNFKGTILHGSPLLLNNIQDIQNSKKITKSVSAPIFKN